VSRADSVTDWSVTGTADLSSDRTVTRYFSVNGVLNQTAGTLTATAQTPIIGQGATVDCAYNMSGSAIFNSGSQELRVGNSDAGGSGGRTWSLTDSAQATIGLLRFHQANSTLLLNGGTSVSTSDLNIETWSNTYISFATGSTATLTVSNKVLADYQAYVTAGKIRVDGEPAAMSQFQVAGHTLSLSTGGPTPPHLVITSVDPASPTAGTGFSVTVQAQDEFNAPAPLAEASEVTLTLKSGTGTGTLGGTMSGIIAATSSSVTIIGTTYTKAESGVVLTASGGSLAAGDSAPFTVVPGAPAKLAFDVQPRDTSTGVAISPAVTVLVQDENGNTVTGDASSVTISSSTTDFTFGSELTMEAVDGVATFGMIEPTTEGSGITLTASDGLLTEATSNSFTVGADSVLDWTVTGTVNRVSDRTVTRYFTVGYTTNGTLNQTAGTITANFSTLIGQVLPAGTAATYNMSGSAHFSGTGGVLFGNAPASTAAATWSLTDTASATIGTLQFGQASQAAGSRYVLLSGAATFNATSLAFNNMGTSEGNMNYISFATGSTATFTAGDKVEADYQVLVAAGNIRVDGVMQTDFSAFQVTGNTLSLGSGGASPYTSWAGGHAFDSLNSEGVAYGMAWLLGATTNSSPSIGLLPTVTGASGGFLTVHFTRVLDPGATAKLYLEYSDNLGTWTSVEVPAATGPVSGVEFTVGTSGALYDITAQIPLDSSAKRFARLVATE
jgi:hypothetical protein